MKTKFKNFGLILLALLVVVGCSKDDEGGSGGSTTAGTVEAKVDGSSFTSNSSFTAAQKVDAGGSTTVTIQGSDNSGKGIVFVINDFDGVGTYNIGGGANISVVASYIEVSASSQSAWQAPYDESIAGELKISEDGESVKGTFHFTAENIQDQSMKEITEGSFNVEFQ